MDTAIKKSNKENTKPVAGQKRPESKNVIQKQKLVRVPPLQSKNDLKQDKKEGNAVEKAEAKEQVKPVTKTSVSDPDKRKTLSQAFRTEQSVQHKKLVAEAQKPPLTVPPKPIPGTYKGRVVKSKIDCFRRPPSGEEKIAEAKFAKPSVPKSKPETGTFSKVRSQSVTALPSSSRPRPQPYLSSRTKSVSDAQLNVVEKPVQRSISQRQIPPRAPSSARPTVPRPATIPARPAPVTTARPASSKVTSFIRKKEPAVQSTKPKPAAAAAAAAVEQKTNRPASNGISQYRVRVETAEERKAKLAEWLALKGKTLKRPPISEKAARPGSKPAMPPKAMQEPSTVAQPELQTQPEEKQPVHEVLKQSQPEHVHVPQSKPVFSSSPNHIMNTTLDLLDNSDLDLPADPEIRMESLVLNLCDKLEAMETPSSCKNAGTKTEESDETEILANIKVEEDTDKEFEILEEEELDVKEESLNAFKEDKKEIKVQFEEKVQEQKEKKLFKSESDEEEEEDDDDDDNDEKIDATPEEVAGASVVKYNVKTTPFLQSVKKRFETEGQTAGSGSRRKSAIKDLKFLTPVRRSSRIQRKSSRLPDMLSDHDPCVSSLAELVQLDDADSNAYIYRKNPALLDQLPDQPGDLERLSAERK